VRHAAPQSPGNSDVSRLSVSIKADEFAVASWWLLTTGTCGHVWVTPNTTAWEGCHHIVKIATMARFR